MERKDKQALKYCLKIAKLNNHKKFLAHLESFEPPTLNQRINNKLSLKFFIIKTIIGQQVSVKAAQATWKKVEPILNKKLFKKADLQNLGLSKMKQEYIWGIFNHFSNNKISKKYLKNCSVNELEEIFLCLKGVGPWTLNIIRMFYICDEDVWLPEDLAIKKSFKYFFHDKDSELVQNLYSPFRTYLCLYLWSGVKLIK